MYRTMFALFGQRLVNSIPDPSAMISHLCSYVKQLPFDEFVAHAGGPKLGIRRLRTGVKLMG